MKIGNKDYPMKTNLTVQKCPICSKLMRLKPPCCSDPLSWMACPCGFKVRYVIDTENNSAGAGN